MTDNIFMISDASYSFQTKCAGLGVVDLHSGKKYSHPICDVKDSHDAEYRALLLSVKIAIKNKYENVVFVYDNSTLNLNLLKKYLKDKIKSFQFLWLKRVFVKEADALARKARKLQEKLSIKTRKIDDKILVDVFKEYSANEIIKSFLVIANKNEYEILKTYINNKKYSPCLIDEKSIVFFSTIYYLLSKTKCKKRFLKFIDWHYPKIMDINEFKSIRKKSHYTKIIKSIIFNLKEKNNTIKDR